MCILPDPCSIALNPCGAGAACRRMELTATPETTDEQGNTIAAVATHRCECDTTEFTKPAYESSITDCITDEVCLARGNQYPLYNAALDEPITDGSSCGESTLPTHTVWSKKPWAESLDRDFGPFLSESFASCQPPSMVGRHGCLEIVDTEQATHASELLWDLQFSNWGASGNGGSFSYVRWHSVADAEVCSS
jgi:hypothetical protein